MAPLHFLFLHFLVVVGTHIPRLVLYYDQWHPAELSPSFLRDVTHVTLAFIYSANITTGAIRADHRIMDRTENEVPGSPGYRWHRETSEQLRKLAPWVKVSIAVGGWGDTSGGFGAATATEQGIDEFSNNIKYLIDTYDFDGVDIDWEYPGGGGALIGPTGDSAAEIDNFPRLLERIKSKIGDKELSVAVPASDTALMPFLRDDRCKVIGTAVNYVNVMSYDFFNRRDTLTSHHSSLERAKQSVQLYMNAGLPADKMNLGVALYAKWAQVVPGCKSPGGLGCPTLPMEDSGGADSGASGVMTFAAENLQEPDPIRIFATPSADGSGTRCGSQYGGTTCNAGLCCSTEGWCGHSDAHCGPLKCQHSFSLPDTCAPGPDLWASWREANKQPFDDPASGAVSYLDRQNNLFWTWDSTAYVQEKLSHVYRGMGLGGVMAWSLGEENMETQDHLNALRAGIQEQTEASSSQGFRTYTNGYQCSSSGDETRSTALSGSPAAGTITPTLASNVQSNFVVSSVATLLTHLTSDQAETHLPLLPSLRRTSSLGNLQSDGSPSQTSTQLLVSAPMCFCG